MLEKNDNFLITKRKKIVFFNHYSSTSGIEPDCCDVQPIVAIDTKHM